MKIFYNYFLVFYEIFYLYFTNKKDYIESYELDDF